MMLAAPELVVAELVEMLDEVEVAAELQHRMLADRMMRGEKCAEIQTRHVRTPVELDALDNPHIALGALAEHLEGFPIAGAVMGRGRLRDAVEFDDHDALDEAGFVGLGRVAAREEAPATRLDCRTGELSVA